MNHLLKRQLGNRPNNKLSLLSRWACAMICSIGAIASAQVAVPKETVPVQNWAGLYATDDSGADEFSDEVTIIAYQIRILEGANEGKIDIVGFEINETLLATTRHEGNELVLLFKAFENSNAKSKFDRSPYRPGQELLRLRKYKTPDRFNVKWVKLQPSSKVKSSDLRLLP
jgi:hypothetical protein